MQHRTTTTLLAAAVVLLAANLIASESPAKGEATGGDPYIVKVLPRSHQSFHRVWSDGQVDTMQRSDGTCDYELTSGHGPVLHPFPVVDAVQPSNHDVKAVMITFEDGRIDLVGEGAAPNRCTVAGVGTPSLCTADADRDGEVGVVDLLTLLGQWGPCN